MGLLTDDWRINALLILCTLLIWAYLKIRSVYSYFEKLGLPYVKPTFLIGSDVRGALGKDSISLSFARMYEQLKNEKIGGVYMGVIPLFMINEPEYVNAVFTTNFEHFHDRPFLVDEKTNPLEEHLFFLKGNKWRYLRNKLSPVFTSGKLKYMYDEMYKCSDMLIECMDRQADGKDIDIHETLGQFATDVIGSTAFGLEPDCLKNPNSEFRAMGKKFFEPSLRNTLQFFFRFAAPRLLITLKYHTTEKIVSDYFLSVINQVFAYRRKNAVIRKDFVQLSLELKEKGFVEIDNVDKTEDREQTLAYCDKSSEKYEITDNLLAAQSFVFFLAGFETTSVTMHFLLYMLSTHKEAQDKVREEVRRVKQKFGKFTYDGLKELTFLDKCIAETLRLFPPVGMLNRECTKDFTFPDGTTIKKGEHLIIPIFALQRDPRYFPDPEEFKPERFDGHIIKGTYAPFGDGPRICIGKRFAQVEMKMAVSKLIDRYYFEESALTKRPITFARTMTLNPGSPLFLKIRRCEDNK